MAKFYTCKYCAFETPNLQSLIINSCSRSPSKHHEPYKGEEKRFYHCEHCGTECSTLLTRQY